MACLIRVRRPWWLSCVPLFRPSVISEAVTGRVGSGRGRGAEERVGNGISQSKRTLLRKKADFRQNGRPSADRSSFEN